MILENSAVPRLPICLLALAGLSASVQAQTPSFSAQIASQSLGSTTVSLNLSVTNTSLAAAKSVTITSVTARVTLGAGALSLAAPSLPLALGDIGPNASAVAGLTLNAAPGIRRFSVVENVTAQDSAGNAYQFSLSQLVNVSFASLSVSASASFGTQPVGGPNSNYQLINVYNNGALPVSLGSITASGDFVVSSAYPGCPQTLAAGSSCYVAVSFSPTAAGPRTGTLTLNDNAFGNPHTVALTGTGQTPQPILSFSPASLSFGAQRMGSPASLYVNVNNAGDLAENFSSVAITGPNASDFLVGGNSCGISLRANQSCSVYVSFIPSAAGSRAASLVFTDSVSGSTYTTPLSGTGQTATTLSLPVALTFATPALNTTGPASYATLSNTGTTPIGFTSFTVTGANASDFAITQNSCLSGLAIGAQCQIAVQLTPSAAGTRTATLAIVDNAVGSPHTVALATSPTGTSTISLGTKAIHFASQYVGATSYTSQLFVQNTGGASLTFSSFTLSGMNPTDFSITYNQCSGGVAPQSYCYIYLTFTPSAPGARTAALTLVDNAADSPQTVMLSGTGTIPPVVTFNPSAVSFPATNLGSAVSQDISISNTGTVPLSFYNFYLGGNNAGDFAITANSCSTSGSFAVGASCTVTVAFTPQAASPRSAFLTVSDNTTTSPHVVFLGGNGAVATPTLAFSNLVLLFGNSPVGAASYSQPYFTVTNTGNAPAQFSSIAVTGANATDFAISANSNSCGSLTNQTLSPNQYCSLQVFFTPSAPGPRTAQLTFTGTASGSPQSITLTGNGTSASAAATFSASELDFAATALGAVGNGQSVTFTNTSSTALNVLVSIGGDNAADFAISQNGCALSYNNVLPAGASCYISIDFIPTFIGNRKASLLFTDAAISSPQTVVLTGVGAAPAESLSASPTSVTFQSQTVGVASQSQTVTLANTGNSPVTFSAYTFSGANTSDFSVTYNSCLAYNNNVLPPGSNCSLSVAFTPGGSGNRTASLNIASDAPGAPLVLSLQGIGVPAGTFTTVTPTTLNFVAPVGATSAAQTVTVVNTGTQQQTISSLAIVGSSGFTVSYGTCGSFYFAGGSCTLLVTYTPQATATVAATLGIVTSAGNLAVALNGSGISPTKTLSVPVSLQFPNSQGVGISTLAQALTIQNTGNDAISLTGFAISGANASDFAIGANSCPASLAPSSSCTLGLVFTPSSAGNRTASLTIGDDANGAPHSIALSGVGILAQKTVAPSGGSSDFGLVNLGSASGAVAFQWTNTGGPNVTVTGISVTGANAGDFTITQTTCTPGLVIPFQINQSVPNYCSASIVFAPSGAGLRSATIQLADDALGSPQSIAISGVGQNLNRAIAAPGSVAFGTAKVGAPYPLYQYVYISNAGDASVTFSSFSLTGANPSDFSLTQNTCGSLSATLPASCYLLIAFSPNGTGVRTANLQIVDNASGSPQSILLQGTGQSVPVTLTINTQAFSFGSVPVNPVQQPTFGTYLLANGGTVSLSGLAITGPNASEFTIAQNQCASLSPPNAIPNGGYCYISVGFNPSSALGARSATLNIYDNASSGYQSVPISAYVVAANPSLSLTPSAVNLGSEGVGSTSASQSVGVSSNGNATVTFTNIAITGTNAADFAISNNGCLPSFASGLPTSFGCNIQVAFTPSAIGNRSAALTFTDNASGGVQSIPLLGIGLPAQPSLLVAPSQLAFSAAVSAPSNIYANAKSVFFTNTGTTNISFSAATISGPNAADFTINNSYNSCQNLNSSSTTNILLPSAQCAISIAFTPTLVGMETATLSVTGSNSVTPQTVSLFGQGLGARKVLTVGNNIVTFSSTNVGSTNTSYAYLSNAGNANVTLSSLAITGANASDFTLGSNSCTVGVQISYSCDLNVSFTPSQPGVRTATIQVTDDASNATSNIYLIGNATVPQALVAPTYGSFFQSVAVGASATAGSVGFYNYSSAPLSIGAPVIAGANAADFSFSSSSCSNPLPANSYCYVYVTFSPSAPGFRDAVVQINFAGSGGFPATALLAGMGLGGSGYLSLETAGLEFDATTIDQPSVSQNVAFLNTGQGPIQVGALTFSGANAGDFTASASNCSPAVPAGSTCQLSVQFIPTGSGLRTATLTIGGNAANSPQTVSLIGIGQAPAEVLYANTTRLGFPSTILNSNSTGSVSLVSGGTSNVTLSNVAITGANASEFTISSIYCPSVLSSSCGFTLQFAPTAAGVRTASLSISSDAPGSPLVIPLYGIGVNPSSMITFSPSVVNFGFANVSSSALSTVSVYDSGSTAVNFSAPTLTGDNAADFTITSSACSKLSSGSYCNISLAFTPSAVGLRSASLQLNDDAPGAPQTIVLQGTGQFVSKLLTSNSAIADFGVQDVGAVVAKSSLAALVNSGNAAVTIGPMAISGPNAQDFQVSSTSLSNGMPCSPLSPNADCYLTLVFTPSIVGAETATLVVQSDSSAGPVVISLAGVGQTPSQRLVTNTGYLDLGSSPLGSTSVTSTVLVSNTGADPVSFTPATITGPNAANFSVTSQTCGTSLSSGSSCTFTLSFTPNSIGSATASLAISSNAANSPLTVTLIGVGTAASGPIVNVTSPIAFGAQTSGTTSIAQNALIYNVGTSTLTVSGATIGGANASDFSLVGSFAGTILPGASKAVGVQFKPSATGPRTAQITITDSAPGSPHVITLTGTGQ